MRRACEALTTLVRARREVLRAPRLRVIAVSFRVHSNDLCTMVIGAGHPALGESRCDTRSAGGTRVRAGGGTPAKKLIPIASRPGRLAGLVQPGIALTLRPPSRLRSMLC